MTQFVLHMKKDLGLQREVMDALPYAVVGGSWKGTFATPHDLYTALTHIVPGAHQLKILFLRVWTQEPGGAVFTITQTNPAAGTVLEGFPPVGNVPTGVRDYPMLEAPGAEVLHGSLVDPIHVLEGSVDFGLQHTPTPATGSYYGITWWGVQKIPEPGIG